MAQAGLIADRSVQYEYRRFFRDRLFGLGAGPTSRRGAAAPAFSGAPHGGPNHTATDDFAPPLPPLPGRRNREIVLGIFVAHPALIDEWVENLAAIDFPEPELDNLRRSILQVAHTDPGLDAQTLRQHLALCGHAQTLGALAITTARHAGFAVGRGDDPEVIRQGLTETLQLLQTRRPQAKSRRRAVRSRPTPRPRTRVG